MTTELEIDDLHVLPVSALEGDNIVDRSARTPWYDGPALLELLETLPSADESTRVGEPFRLPVQSFIRPQGGLSPELAADPDADGCATTARSPGALPRRHARGRRVEVSGSASHGGARHPGRGRRGRQRLAPQSVSLHSPTTSTPPAAPSSPRRARYPRPAARPTSSSSSSTRGP